MLGISLLIGTGMFAIQEIIKAYAEYQEDKTWTQNMLHQIDASIKDLSNKCECSTCTVKLAKDILKENTDNLPVTVSYINRNGREHIYFQITRICTP